MSKWLDQARSSKLSTPAAKTAKTAITPTFGTFGAFGRPTEDEKVAFEERAAISEYDGGLPRSHAELMAAACLVPLAPDETSERREATIIHFAEHLDRIRRTGHGGPDAA